MIVVLPFYSGDEPLAYKNICWMQTMDGTIDADCVLVYDYQTKPERVAAVAEKLFRKVHLYTYKPPPIRKWPNASNWVFQHTVWHMTQFKQPWLWIESDCVPLKPGWYQTVKECHEKGGKPFTGHWNERTKVWNGVSVYPHNTQEYGQRLMLVQNNPWDVSASKDIYPHLNVANHVFQHIWHDEQTGQAWTFPDMATVKKVIRNGCVLYHRCKDGSLIDRLAVGEIKDEKGHNIFVHGGDVGDLLYGLPTIRKMGGGTLYMNQSRVREPFTEQKANLLIPLLKQQSYIKGVEYQENPPAGINFNRFRELLRKGMTLAQAQLKMFKQTDSLKAPWLQVDHAVSIADKPVILHRSSRYQNSAFPWGNIVDKYRKQAVFIGLDREHAAFCKAFGAVDHHPTADFLEAARLIAGAKLFVGNQSAPYAIAEGLKQTAILEACPTALDCQFKRDNLQNDPNGKVVLPDL